MLARTVAITILCIGVTSLQAAQSKAAKGNSKCDMVNKCHLSTSGKIQLKINTEELNSEIISLATNNNKITGDLRLYHSHIYDDFSYKDVIKGEFVLDNLSEHHAHIQYQLIFKDDKGMVAKTIGNISLPQGKGQPINCSNIPLSVKDIKSISLYEIKLIASNKEIGI